MMDQLSLQGQQIIPGNAGYLLFVVDKVDGVGDKVSGNTIAVCVQMPFKSF
jgi:hypothetical protein